MALSEKNISNMLEKIPTFSQSVIRILDLTSDVNFSTKELVNQISHDPILTVRVLRLVNSAYFGLSREVTSIQHAVVYVGSNTIKNLAISIAAMGALPRKNKAGMEMDHFWLHSLVTAVMSRQIALQNQVPTVEISSYFISGLLHDIGQIIFSQALPEEYKQVLNTAKESARPLHEIEREAFSVDHADLGAMLGERWQLPQPIVDAIKHHHSPQESTQSDNLVNSLFVANQIAKLNEEVDTGVSIVEEIPESLGSWIKVPLDEFMTSLGDISAELENAKLFIQLGK